MATVVREWAGSIRYGTVRHALYPARPRNAILAICRRKRPCLRSRAPLCLLSLFSIPVFLPTGFWFDSYH